MAVNAVVIGAVATGIIGAGATGYSVNRQNKAARDARGAVRKDRRKVDEMQKVRESQAEQKRRRLLQLAGDSVAAGPVGQGLGTTGTAQVAGKTRLGH